MRFGAVSSVFAGRIKGRTAVSRHVGFCDWLAENRTFNLKSHYGILWPFILGPLTFSICCAPAFHAGLLALEGVNGDTLRLGNVVAAGVAARAMAIVPAHLSRSVGGGHGFMMIHGFMCLDASDLVVLVVVLVATCRCTG